MNFEKKAIHKIKELVRSEQKVLIAVSGGQDSVALAYLFSKTNIPFGIAHCNYQLRDSESNLDEIIVREIAIKLRVPFHLKRFDTAAHCKTKGQSIQEAARELRYHWFDVLLRSHQYDFVATAHHLQDSIETTLFNLTKGTGIKGLLGIPEKRDKIIRPLVKLSKAALENWANEQSLAFRTDQSNLEYKYARNKIRLSVLPVLKEINPNIEHNFGESLNNIEKVNSIYRWAIIKIRQEIVDYSDPKQVCISIPKLKHLPEATTILFEILRPYSLSKTQILQIETATQAPSGQRFTTPKMEVLVDRENILIRKIVDDDSTELTIPDNLPFLKSNYGAFRFNINPNAPSAFPKDKNEVYLDYEKLVYPLTIRTWRKGDKFCPLGLDGKHQKIQDFYSNNKISQFEKEEIPLLCNGNGDICWIVGNRMDDRYKVTDLKKPCLNIILSKD